MGFDRLIRFEDESGNVHCGDLPYPFPAEGIDGRSMKILRGDIANGYMPTGQEATVKKVSQGFQSR